MEFLSPFLLSIAVVIFSATMLIVLSGHSRFETADPKQVLRFVAVIGLAAAIIVLIFADNLIVAFGIGLGVVLGYVLTCRMLSAIRHYYGLPDIYDDQKQKGVTTHIHSVPKADQEFGSSKTYTGPTQFP